MPGFDMHVHTTASDGSLSIKEIIQLAIQIKLEGIAITDHDTIGGLEEAVSLGEELGFPIIPGIELSTEYGDKEIHVLGFFIDFHQSWFKEKIAMLQDARINRIVKIVDKLKKLGYDVDVEEVLTLAGEGSVGRPHIAKILYEKGYFSYPQEAFQRLIGRGGKAYVPRFKMTPSEGISFIRKAEGIPVLAHPGLSDADHLILPLIREGLMGIEVFHPDHKINDESKYMNIAKEHKLFITGGSDFHGIMGGNRSALGSRFVSSNIWHELISVKKEIKSNGNFA